MYVEDVSRDPYCGTARVGVKAASWLMLRIPRRESSVSVNTVLLRGCWRSRATSFGCDTTISSSRSITRDVSIRLSTTAEGAIPVSVFAVRASGKNKVAASVILGLFIF